jgi:hypothetical protein
MHTTLQCIFAETRFGGSFHAGVSLLLDALAAQTCECGRVELDEAGFISFLIGDGEISTTQPFAGIG